MSLEKKYYTCQQCQKFTKNIKIIKCGGCNKELCFKCSVNEFCPSCLVQLNSVDKSKALNIKKKLTLLYTFSYLFMIYLIGVIIYGIATDFLALTFIMVLVISMIGFILYLVYLSMTIENLSPTTKQKKEIWARREK